MTQPPTKVQLDDAFMRGFVFGIALAILACVVLVRILA